MFPCAGINPEAHTFFSPALQLLGGKLLHLHLKDGTIQRPITVQFIITLKNLTVAAAVQEPLQPTQAGGH